MRLVDERTGLEVLPSDECQRLLATRRLGRIGLSVAGRPVILPVNYVFDRGTIVFRTGEGTKFDTAVRGAFVAFEIDDADMAEHTGWSVLVTGVAEEISDSDEIDRAEALRLRPWARGIKTHYLRLTPVTVTGRRIAAQIDDGHGHA